MKKRKRLRLARRKVVVVHAITKRDQAELARLMDAANRVEAHAVLVARELEQIRTRINSIGSAIAGSLVGYNFEVGSLGRAFFGWVTGRNVTAGGPRTR